MKKLFLLLVLSALCFVNPTGNYAFAGESVVDWEEDDESCEEDGGGSSNWRVGYRRIVNVLNFATGYDVHGGVTGISTQRQYYQIRLSCCCCGMKGDTCNFADDDTDCNKYIDRKTGNPFEVRTHSWE